MTSEHSILLKVIRKNFPEERDFQPCLNLADAQANHFAELIDRYLRDFWPSGIPDILDQTYLEASPLMIRYGLCMHLICIHSTARIHFQEVNQDEFYYAWSQNSARAASAMTVYGPENQRTLETVFKDLYSKEVELAVSRAHLGLWRSARVQAVFRDCFATGLVFGMTLDSMSSRLRGKWPRSWNEMG